MVSTNEHKHRRRVAVGIRIGRQLLERVRSRARRERRTQSAMIEMLVEAALGEEESRHESASASR